MPIAPRVAFEFFKAPLSGEGEDVLTAENSHRFYKQVDSIPEKMRDFPEETYAFRIVLLKFIGFETAVHPLSGMIFLDAEPLNEAFVRTRDGLTAPFDPKNDHILTRDANGVWNERKSIPHPR